MKKQKESLIEDLYAFLKILAENSRGYIKRREEEDWKNYIKRSEKELAKIFGKEKLENLIDLCFEQGYIMRESVKGIPKKRGFEEDFYAIRIQGKGLKYLEEFEREKRKESYSKLMIIANFLFILATIGLLVVTGIYSGIAKKSFESENRPYIYIKSISTENFELNDSVYNLQIENFGNFPGRLLDIKILPSCAKEFTLGEFPRTTVLKKNEEFGIDINEHGACGEEITIPIEIRYTGIGQLSEEVYIYSASIYINKIRKSLNIDEGKI